MPVPATTGILRTKVSDMEIGDYIVCRHTQLASGNISPTSIGELGTTIAAEIPLTGSATPNGSFYFIKVGKGFLIADRVVQHTISWDVLNSQKYIQGLPWDGGNIAGYIRSLTGGVAYADANGNMSNTDIFSGGYPTNNEWNKYVVNFPAKKIQIGATLNDVFHFNAFTWVQDTPILAINSSNNRIYRSIDSSNRNRLIANLSTYQSSTAGFRPVLEYKEV